MLHSPAIQYHIVSATTIIHCGINLPYQQKQQQKKKEKYASTGSVNRTNIAGHQFSSCGTEFLRSKNGVENSYNSPDSINAIDWDLKTKNKDVFEYVKALIKMRKEHPAFRMADAKSIKENINFLEMGSPGFIVFDINGGAVNDKWKTIRVYLNGTAEKEE